MKENPHDRFLFFGTAVPRGEMADYRRERLEVGDLALYPPKEALFEKMNKKRMYITADHGVAGTDAQGMPCIVKHPERVGEFLFDYEHRETGDYTICGMLYGTEQGKAMARRMMHGKDDCLSLSHDTILYTDPVTKQQSISFSGNHVAVLNSSETPPGRDGCHIHHLVPLSKSNSLIPEMLNVKIHRENRQLDRRIEELARNLNAYLSKNPVVGTALGIDQSHPDRGTMAEQQKQQQEAADGPMTDTAPASSTNNTTTTTTNIIPPASGETSTPTLQELSAQRDALAAQIQEIKSDPTKWFSSEAEYNAAINSDDPQKKLQATAAYAEMAMREKQLSDLSNAIKDAEAKAMQAKLEEYEKQVKAREAELEQKAKELTELSSHTLKGNFNEIMQTCGAEAGMTEERMKAMHRAYDVASALPGDQGRAIVEGLQIMTTSCSKLGRAAAGSAAGRFGQKTSTGSSLVGGLFGNSSTSMPFAQKEIRNASSGIKRPAPESMPSMQDAAKKQATGDTKPVYFSPTFTVDSMRANPSQYESEEFSRASQGFMANLAKKRMQTQPQRQ